MENTTNAGMTEPSPAATIEDRLALAEKRIGILMTTVAGHETMLNSDLDFNNGEADVIVKIKNKLAAHGMEVV